MKHLRLLLAEDDFVCNLALGEYLIGEGYSVETVDCGSAAYEAIDRAGVLSALLTDVDLGPGPNGFEVARHARAAYPDLPVVYISSADVSRYACEGVSGSEFIAKPSTPRHVLEALGRVLHLEGA